MMLRRVPVQLGGYSRRYAARFRTYIVDYRHSPLLTLPSTRGTVGIEARSSLIVILFKILYDFS